VNIWQRYKPERGCLVHFARLANTLLRDEERARDNHLQGRLNQWAHPARAQGPRIFFFLMGFQLAVLKYFLKLIILLLMLLHERTNTSKIDLQ